MSQVITKSFDEAHQQKLKKYKALYNQNNPDFADNFIYHYREQFSNLDLRDKDILEIGCGKGFLSLFMAYIDEVKHVDSLDEAEGEGSSTDVLEALRNNVNYLEIKNISIVKNDILNHHKPGAYDVIVSNNAMHHICEHGLLKWDVRAMKKYVEIFEHVKRLLKPGGLLLMHEYSRLSIWRFISNKRFSDIEWSLHPTKGEWQDVLERVGFQDIKLKYSVPYKLRKIGCLVKNPFVMFLYYPSFFIRARNFID